MKGQTGIWAIAIAALCQAAGADDALVLPAGMWRLYAVPSLATVEATFDDHGRRQPIRDQQGQVSSLNLGLAVERGVNRWLTAGVQWTPGVTLSSSLDFPDGDPAGRDRAHFNDCFDALAGVKIGLLGSPARDPRRVTGLAQSQHLRLALGLALKFPVRSIDWEAQGRRLRSGDTYLAQAADKHTLAPVVGLHLDAVVRRSPGSEFFVDFYAQYVDYVSPLRYGDTAVAGYLDPTRSRLPFDARYDLFIETEPRYDLWLFPGRLRTGLYLPVRTRFLPAPVLGRVPQGHDGQRTTMAPAVNLLAPFRGGFVELRVGYQMSVAGRNATAPSTATLVLRVIP
jgi:hypothetical protein